MFRPIKNIHIEIPTNSIIDQFDRCWSPSFVRIDSKDNVIGLNWTAIFKKTRDIQTLKGIYSGHGIHNLDTIIEVLMCMIEEDHESISSYIKFMRDIAVEIPIAIQLLLHTHKDYHFFHQFILNEYCALDISDNIFADIICKIEYYNKTEHKKITKRLIDICYEYNRGDDLEKYINQYTTL